MAIVKQRTGKPFVDEMRTINGVVMIWTGTKWIIEKGWAKANAPKLVTQ